MIDFENSVSEDSYSEEQPRQSDNLSNEMMLYHLQYNGTDPYSEESKESQQGESDEYGLELKRESQQLYSRIIRVSDINKQH
jgi:hypothetical protein